MIEKLLNNIKLEILNIVHELGGTEIEEKDVFFEIPASKEHGDYSTNIAFKLARTFKKSPFLIANDIIAKLDKEKFSLSKVEVVNGFINLFIDKSFMSNIVFKINKEAENFGNSTIGAGQKINIEYVSANPTGFLHIGHCRGAAYGDSLARIMTKAGYKVTREYYVNDNGNQINNLAKSIYARYRELFGLDFVLDDDCYHGKEIILIAQEIKDKYGDKYLKEDWYSFFRKYGVDSLLNNLKLDLKDFNVEFDVWSSERSLYEDGSVENIIKLLEDKGYTYEADGATWLKTTLYGDEKDRVLKKSDGSLTYLTPDIAYHANKLSRGFDHLIDVLGADHHGYIPRLKAAIAFVGGNPDLLDVEILQMVRALQKGEEVKMSKRSGKAITMRDLIDEIGTDALRYLFVEKSLSSQMDLDLDIAVKQSNENPVYYAQYAYARISGLFRIVDSFDEVDKFEKIDLEAIESILSKLTAYPSVVEEAAVKRIPHKICQYVSELAKTLHSYYNNEKIVSDDKQLTNEKLTLMKAIGIVLKNALSLVGVGVKDKM